MFGWLITLLVIALIAATLKSGWLASIAIDIAKAIFVVLLLVLAIITMASLSRTRPGDPVSRLPSRPGDPRRSR